MRQQLNTGAWMHRHGIDRSLLTWAKQEAKHQSAEPIRCVECGGELPTNSGESRCPHCGADVVPFQRGATMDKGEIMAKCDQAADAIATLPASE